ncbi:peptidase inhibitor family I36 protein [Streptomyces olindensis]|uniref:peptidase inhibitor family I36 protein n=1 Tax=Streptomyces olindensis TaxID=358823 RepID=UPI0033D008C4
MNRNAFDILTPPKRSAVFLRTTSGAGKRLAWHAGLVAVLTAFLLPLGAVPALSAPAGLGDCPQYRFCVYAAHNFEGRPTAYKLPAGRECLDTREGRSYYNTMLDTLRVWEFSNCTGRSELVAVGQSGNATAFTYDAVNSEYCGGACRRAAGGEH